MKRKITNNDYSIITSLLAFHIGQADTNKTASNVQTWHDKKGKKSKTIWSKYQTGQINQYNAPRLNRDAMYNRVKHGFPIRQPN